MLTNDDYDVVHILCDIKVLIPCWEISRKISITLQTNNHLSYAIFISFSPPVPALQNADQVAGHILVVQRGYCTFVEKARRAQTAGAVGVIVFDNDKTSSIHDQPLFAMSGDGTDDVTIPVVFLYATEAAVLEKAIEARPLLEVSDLGLVDLMKGLNDKKTLNRIEKLWKKCKFNDLFVYR